MLTNLIKTCFLPTGNLQSNNGEKLRAIIEERDACHKRHSICDMLKRVGFGLTLPGFEPWFDNLTAT